MKFMIALKLNFSFTQTEIHMIDVIFETIRCSMRKKSSNGMLKCSKHKIRVCIAISPSRRRFHRNTEQMEQKTNYT